MLISPEPWMKARVVAGAGTGPEETVESVNAALDERLPVALGFEAPLVLPVPFATSGASARLGRARPGEHNRSWSAGAGAGALATGTVQLAWILDRLVAVRIEDLPMVTTKPAAWTAGRADLLLWEAFVSGEGKPVPAEAGPHAADAAAAAKEFGERLTPRIAEGRDAVNAMIGTVQSQFPDLTMTLAGPVDGHHDQARFTWGLGPAGAEPLVVGFDVIECGADGRITKVLGFLDKVPTGA